VRHAQRCVGEVLGQRRQWPSRFGQHDSCGNKRIAHGRELDCSECWCTHQHRHHDNNDNDNNDNDNNGRTNHNDNNNNDNSRTNYNVVYNNLNLNLNYVIDNNSCAARDHRSFNNHHSAIINNYVNHTGETCCATAHGQRI
jgi:hypothetical protein